MKSYIDTKYEVNKIKEKLQRKIAWSLPRSIAMWTAIRVIAHATTGKWSSQVVPDLSAMDALERWNNPDAPRPIHPNLVDAHNYITSSKKLERKQGYKSLIDSARLPRKLKVENQTFKLKFGDIDDSVFLSYVDDQIKVGTEGRVLMHYEESTLKGCITKAWRRFAEDGIRVNEGIE